MADSLQRLRDFLEFLKSEGIAFDVEDRPEFTVAIGFNLLGARVRVEFDPDRMTFTRIDSMNAGARESSALDALLSRFAQTAYRRPPLQDMTGAATTPYLHDLLWLQACFRNRQSAF